MQDGAMPLPTSARSRGPSLAYVQTRTVTGCAEAQAHASLLPSSLFVLMFTAWMAWRWPTSLARGYDMRSPCLRARRKCD